MNKTLGATLLIAGCCIGAGMLGIPVVTGPAGFLPAGSFFILAWAFMALCGLVLTELVFSFDKPFINLLSMAEETMGKWGKSIASLLFAFLFYAIMMAYVIGSATIISDFSTKILGFPLSFTVAATGFTAIMYLVIANGVRMVDKLNRALMFGLILCYALLVAFGLPQVETDRLARSDWSMALLSLPILVISFGFHNLVPTLVNYLERKKAALIKAIWIGSAIPLVVYILWEYVILGLVPFDNLTAWVQANNGGEIVTQVLIDTTGSGVISHLATGFAFFAIATSFLPVAFSFLDFLHDGLPKISRPLLAVLVLIPPYIGAMCDSHFFLEALGIAGGYCAVTLFGILPVIMAWKRQNHPKYAHHFVISKKPLLMLLFVASCVVVAVELSKELGLL